MKIKDIGLKSGLETLFNIIKVDMLVKYLIFLIGLTIELSMCIESNRGVRGGRERRITRRVTNRVDNESNFRQSAVSKRNLTFIQTEPLVNDQINT